MRKFLTAMALALGLAAASVAVASAPAMASASSPATHAATGFRFIPVHPTTFTGPQLPGAAEVPLVGNNKLCEGSHTSECITAEGVGVVMEVESSGYSTFSTSIAGNGNTIYRDQAGPCVHGTDNGTVTVSNNCAWSNTASVWEPAQDGAAILWTNEAYSEELDGRGDSSGDYVGINDLGFPGAYFVESYLT